MPELFSSSRRDREEGFTLIDPLLISTPLPSIGIPYSVHLMPSPSSVVFLSFIVT